MLTKKGLLSTGALALAILPIASPAMAQSFSPASSTTTLSGLLNLQQSININCQVQINASIDAAGQATVTSRSFSPGNPLCGGAVTPFGTWTLSPDNPTQVSATVGSTSVLGTCSGSITGTWNNATNSVTFTNAIVPGTPAPCIVNGTLTSVPGVTIP